MTERSGVGKQKIAASQVFRQAKIPALEYLATAGIPGPRHGVTKQKKRLTGGAAGLAGVGSFDVQAILATVQSVNINVGSRCGSLQGQFSEFK